MPLKFLTEGVEISRRKLAAVLLLNSGTLAWFFLLVLQIPDISAMTALNEPLYVYYNIGPAFFLGFAVFWSIVGSFIGRKVDRRNLLIFSIALGTFSTILLSLNQGIILAAISNLLLGMSFGLGLPSSMALIADYTVVEDRARVSGIIILGTFVLAFASMVAIQILRLDISGIILFLALMRSVSFAAFVIDDCRGQERKAANRPYLPSIGYRQLALYLVPWIIFSITSILAWNLFPLEDETIAAAVSMGSTLRYILIAVFGLVSGFIADRFGRKQPIIIGLIVLGIGFALLGFFGIIYTNIIVFLAISGVAWGSFFVLFLTVPGDLSVVGSREKFYGIGYILPISIMLGFSAIPGGSLFAGQSASSFSQICSAILFLSIIPVLRAKDTLNESKIQERKMKEYAERVGKSIRETKEN